MSAADIAGRPGSLDSATGSRPIWAPSRLASVVAPLVVVAVILLVWQAATAGGFVSPLLLPAPTAIAGALVTSAATLAVNTAYTGIEALVGFGLGNLAGFVVALAFVRSDLGRRAVFPLATAAQAVPIVAVIPALILWFGNGMAPKIFVAAFLAFFPMLVNALRGLRSADAEVTELLYTLSASPWQTMRMVRLPASTRYVFNALRLSACACVVSALVAEWVAADHGLGYLIVLWSSQYRMPDVWAAVLVGTALSMAVYGLVVWCERVATPWAIGRDVTGR